MPQAVTFASELPAGRATIPFSAWRTPSWHHTEEMTRIVVFARANGTLSRAVFSVHRSGSCPRMVK